MGCVRVAEVGGRTLGRVPENGAIYRECAGSRIMEYALKPQILIGGKTMIRFITVFILTLLAVSPAWAQDAIGFVKTVSGNAAVVDVGKTIKARVGTPIKMGNTLKTGPTGAMGVTFKDNTVMSFGPDTELTVDEYLYAPGKDNLKFSTSMSKGSLQVVSGVIAKLKPKSVTLKTPTGMIGCRGTRFLVKVEP